MKTPDTVAEEAVASVIADAEADDSPLFTPERRMLEAARRAVIADRAQRPLYVVGEPDPTNGPLYDCPATHVLPISGHRVYCTWGAGHEKDGTPHVAGDSRTIVAVWL